MFEILTEKMQAVLSVKGRTEKNSLWTEKNSLWKKENDFFKKKASCFLAIKGLVL